MAPPAKPVLLLTGASTGLGLALSRLLLEKGGFRLILTARESSLERFAEEGIFEGEELWLRPLDITVPEQRLAIVREATERWGGVDILVNNAGVSYRSVVEHVDESEHWEQMDINFRAPMDLIRLVLPGMRAKRGGRILNVSSVAGMMAMPTMAVYSASKFALEGATESLWYEVRPWDIHVSLIQPGFIRSDSFKKIRLTRLSKYATEDPKEPYFSHYDFMAPFITVVSEHTFATPESIARKIYKTIEKKRPPLRVPVTLDARLFDWMRRWLPRPLYHFLLYVNLPKIWKWGPRQELPKDPDDLVFAPPELYQGKSTSHHGPHSPKAPRPQSKSSPYAAPHAISKPRLRLL